MAGNSYLLVPLCKTGSGTGHLRRMIGLYQSLRKVSSCSLWVSKGEIPKVHQALLSGSVSPDDLVDAAVPLSGSWDFIVIDYRKTPGSLLAKFKSRGGLVGVDEGGLYRNDFQFLIDILPSLPKKAKANISSPGLLELPQKHEYRNKGGDYKKVLITFGGEDPRDLTTEFLKFIQKYGYFRNSEVTVVVNSSSDKEIPGNKIRFLIAPSSLKELLADYDLVITSFGITLFESLASGVPFVLLNPGRYHEKLSAYCGFPSVGVVHPRKGRMDKFLKRGVSYKLLQEKYIPSADRELDHIINHLKRTEAVCPVCSSSSVKNKIIFRTGAGTYFRCTGCKIIYFTPLLETGNSYKKEYFFEEYKNQYGRTYLEDFKNIRTFAADRLSVLKQIGMEPISGNASLLDVGCAYGPFLAEAEHFGYTPEGVELISEAAEYVRSLLGFRVYNGYFEDIAIVKQFDLLTMWYVIEHFNNLESVLARVNKLLKPGGYFAFSTPSSSGVSGRRHLYSFLERSPSDHITVWNPGAAERILPVFGFKVKRVRITGHHPERFPAYNLLKLLIGKKGIMIISKIFKLGDTFEIYAEKIREYNG